jgi:hypothetical protein
MAQLQPLGRVANGKKEGREKKGVFTILKRRFNQNSNSRLNSTSKHRCSNMYATVNSFISLI